MCMNDHVDFGRLDEDMQKEVIQKIKSSQEHRNSLREQAGLDILTNEKIQCNQNSVSEHFSTLAYGVRVHQLYQRIMEETHSTVEFANGRKMLEQFLSPERLNLVRA